MAKAKVNKKMGGIGIELPECPVCMETMSAPIFQCQTGHSLCSTCNKNLRAPVCPICRQSMTQIRNWQLEELISKATVSCPNKPAGCTYTVANNDLEDHVKECIFREMACPLGAIFGKCFWSGKLNGIMDHCKERHPDSCISDAAAGVNINNVSISSDDRHMYIMAQNKFLFLISFKIDTSKKLAYWAVQHIGSKVSAPKNIYQITVTSNQDNRRQVIFNDHCFNDVMDVNEIFRSAKCAVMPLDMLANFIKNQRLTFTFQLKRNQPPFKKDAVPKNENKADNESNHSKAKNSGVNPNQGKGNVRDKSQGPKKQHKNNH